MKKQPSLKMKKKKTFALLDSNLSKKKISIVQLGEPSQSESAFGTFTSKEDQ